MTLQNNNLFTTLQRWVDGQEENYLSESLAYVVRRMFNHCPKIAAEFVNLMTRGQIQTGQLAGGNVDVVAQLHTDLYGTPDIWIRSPDVDVAIEVKVDAPLGPGQLESYRKELNRCGKPNNCLILISRHVVGEEAGEADVSFRWFQIAEFLHRCIQDPSIDPVSEFIVIQFIDHLRFRGFAFFPSRTELSEGINRHFASRSQDAILVSRVRDLDLLREYDELKPLHHLLSLMKAAIDALGLGSTRRFDSAQSPKQWIGYNIQDMKYYFFIYLS